MTQIRRKEREKEKAFAYKVIDKAEYGVLALVDENNKAYAIPLSFVRIDDTIYIHSANEGKKLELIKKNSNVSFTCVGDTQLLSSQFSTYYESAILFGKASIVENNEEKQQALEAIAAKYSPTFAKEALTYIKENWERTTLIRIEIESISGKANLPKNK
jgi:nitroimidazol reductase NimA-like FMN-containing flavoprotein (pyridoxamine 5'-phosphate oxidase superfamily)